MSTTAVKQSAADEAAALRAGAAEREAAAEESFQRCDTDGFLSQWASGITARKMRRQAAVVEAGGVAVFARDYLVETEFGTRIKDARQVQTRYGLKWRSNQMDLWMPVGAGARAQANRGVRVETEHEVAPARADIVGEGRGLSGCATAQVAVVRDDDQRHAGWYLVSLGSEA